MRTPLETLACVNTLVIGELGLTKEQGIALLFQLVAGLAVIREAGGDTPPDFAAALAAAKEDLNLHIAAWQNAADLIGDPDGR